MWALRHDNTTFTLSSFNGIITDNSTAINEVIGIRANISGEIGIGQSP